MNVSGTARLAAPRQAVWSALHDPEVLARTLPGCRGLEQTGPDRFDATLSVGVASIRGTYKGSVVLSERDEPSSYRMQLSGAGTPGTVTADVTVRLEEDGDATTVYYDADAVVGGMIGGVGQRMLGSVANRTAGEFFRSVEAELTGPPSPDDTGEASWEVEDLESTADPGREAASVRVGRLFSASASRPAGTGTAESQQLVGAAVAGGLLALAGVLLGRSLARRSER